MPSRKALEKADRHPGVCNHIRALKSSPGFATLQHGAFDPSRGQPRQLPLTFPTWKT